MARNYYKFTNFKKPVLVFFDDDDEAECMAALNKIQALNVNDSVVSVWRTPELQGPWHKLGTIR